MKKYLSLVLLAVAMMFAQQANAQLKFGVKGGLNVSKISFSEDLFDSSNRMGWFFGPTLKYTLPILGLGIDASALYDQRSSKVEDVSEHSGQTTVKQQSVVVPVNLRLDFGVGSVASVFLFAGPQFGFNVGDDRFNWKNRNNVENVFQLKKSTLSVNVGAGVTLLKFLQVSANCNIASGKTGDAKVRQVADDVYKTISEGKTTSFQVGVACFF